jgi:hypothetical protein
VIATPIDANDKDVRNHAKYVRSFAIIRSLGAVSYTQVVSRNGLFILQYEFQIILFPFSEGVPYSFSEPWMRR